MKSSCERRRAETCSNMENNNADKFAKEKVDFKQKQASKQNKILVVIRALETP